MIQQLIKIFFFQQKVIGRGALVGPCKENFGFNLVDSDAIPLTGNLGLMMKNWLVKLFLGSILSNGSNL
jgi:hypothetical protein